VPPAAHNPSERKPHPIDIHVGKRIRVRRTMMDISQETLADEVGLTFQQIQKYERGSNRVSASRLFQFANILQVPVSYFYDEYVDAKAKSKKAPVYGMSDNEQQAFQTESDILSSKESIELLKIYYSLEDDKKRKELFKIIRSMVENMKSGS